MNKSWPSIRRFSPLHAWRPAAGLAVLLGGLLTGPAAQAQLVSFPGAEGAGKYTSGGRGRPAQPTTVYEVTSLADTNTPGTLRYACSQSATAAPFRTVVFRVCGTIHLAANLRIPANTTLAGQTAPGDGICLADREVSVSGNNVIVRFLRFRLGDRYQNLGMVPGSGDSDAFNGRFNLKTIIDHCSMSWSTDEAFTFYEGDSTSLQWNLISEPLNYSYHFEPGNTDFERHGFGGIWGGRRASFHHNLIAHCKGRMPRFAGSGGFTPVAAGTENVDFRNNVIYDWEAYSSNGGEGGNYNMVNNYYKWGPSTPNTSSGGVPRRAQVMNPSRTTTAPVLPYPRIFLSGNYVNGSPLVTARNWRGVLMSGGTLADTVQSKVSTPFTIVPMPTQTALDAYTSVLQSAGCVLPARDALDQRIVDDVRNRTGAIIDVQGGFPHGTPYSQTTGAWPTLNCGPPPVDTDRDGMPDTYELANGLNPALAADRQGIAANGYTNLENYLNSLVAAVVVTGTRDAATGAAPLLQVYPNPGTGQTTLVHPRATAVARLAVFNFVGQQVASYVVTAGEAETRFSLGALASGNYLLVYTDQGVQLTAKCQRD